MARELEDGVEFMFPDASVTIIPPHIVAKSTLLRDALNEHSDTERIIRLPMQRGILHSWLQLHVDRHAQFDCTAARCPCKPSQRVPKGKLSLILYRLQFFASVF